MRTPVIIPDLACTRSHPSFLPCPLISTSSSCHGVWDSTVSYALLQGPTLPCPDGLLKNAEMPRKGYITSLRPWNEYDCQIPSVWNKIFCRRRILEIRRKSTPKKRTGGSSEDGQMERVSLVSSSPPLNLLWNLSQVIWTLILRSQILICKMWGEERVWGT